MHIPRGLAVDIYQQMGSKHGLLVFAGITQGIGHHMAALLRVVAGRVQMPVQPAPRQRQQRVQCIAEAGSAWREPVTRVSAVQAGREVGHRHCLAVKRNFQRGAQPGLARQCLLANAFGQPGRALSGGKCFAQVVVGCAKGLVAGLELLG